MTDHYYFRVRKYLRNQGEQQLDKFEVMIENNVYMISKWDYPSHPQPNVDTLKAITTAQVTEEIEKTVKPLYDSDIYAFLSERNNVMQITANRQYFCSTVSENQIHLNRIGFYRITVSGKLAASALIPAEFNVIVMHGEERPNIICTRMLRGRSLFHFTGLLSVNGPSKLQFKIELTSSTATYQLTGNALVEFL